jgi:hypothetical protein
MSPVGDAFRARCRMFPSLVNCCTIDWFTEWPKEALLSVSKRFFEFVDLGSEDMKAKISEVRIRIIFLFSFLISVFCFCLLFVCPTLPCRYYHHALTNYYTTHMPLLIITTTTRSPTTTPHTCHS